MSPCKVCPLAICCSPSAQSVPRPPFGPGDYHPSERCSASATSRRRDPCFRCHHFHPSSPYCRALQGSSRLALFPAIFFTGEDQRRGSLIGANKNRSIVPSMYVKSNPRTPGNKGNIMRLSDSQRPALAGSVSSTPRFLSKLGCRIQSRLNSKHPPPRARKQVTLASWMGWNELHLRTIRAQQCDSCLQTPSLGDAGLIPVMDGDIQQCQGSDVAHGGRRGQLQARDERGDTAGFDQRRNDAVCVGQRYQAAEGSFLNRGVVFFTAMSIVKRISYEPVKGGGTKWGRTERGG